MRRGSRMSMIHFKGTWWSALIRRGDSRVVGPSLDGPPLGLGTGSPWRLGNPATRSLPPTSRLALF
jgi:hypothetical protein